MARNTDCCNGEMAQTACGSGSAGYVQIHEDTNLKEVIAKHSRFLEPLAAQPCR
jgi:hypothetical protein